MNKLKEEVEADNKVYEEDMKKWMKQYDIDEEDLKQKKSKSKKKKNEDDD